MKLNKVLALALSGVMAVSMLAGCSGNTTDNGGASSGDTTPSSNYTETVLAETKAATRLVLSANDSKTLNDAVAYAARNVRVADGSNYGTALKACSATAGSIGSGFVTAAKNIMPGTAEYTDFSVNGTKWSFAPSDLKDVGNSKTYWTMAVVSRAVSDEYITEELAKQLDAIAVDMVEDGEVAENATWDYTVSIAKADSLAGKDADRSKDTVVIGVAITFTKTAVKF